MNENEVGTSNTGLKICFILKYNCILDKYQSLYTIFFYFCLKGMPHKVRYPEFNDQIDIFDLSASIPLYMWCEATYLNVKLF